jgi:acyl-CoA thioester hydrolase
VILEKHKIFNKDIEIRARDIGNVGHVANPVYFSYFDEGWLAFFKEELNMSEGNMTIEPILAKIDCTFLKPISYSDNLKIQVWMGDLGGKSFKLKYRLLDSNDEDLVFAEAESIMVCYDYEANKSVLIP